MNLDVSKARSQNVGWVLLTDDKLPNPYDITRLLDARSRGYRDGERHTP
jgi:hypothetical protein